MSTTIIEAQDALGEARSLIDCISLATESLPEGAGRAIQAVAHAASEKIDEAIDLLGSPPTGNDVLKNGHDVLIPARNEGNAAAPIGGPYGEGTRK